MTQALINYYQFEPGTAVVVEKLIDSGLLGVALLALLVLVLFMAWMLRSQRDTHTLTTTIQAQTVVMQKDQEQRNAELKQRAVETEVTRDLAREIGAARESITDTNTNLKTIQRSLMDQDENRNERFENIEKGLKSQGGDIATIRDEVKALRRDLKDELKRLHSGEDIVNKFEAKIDRVLRFVEEVGSKQSAMSVPPPAVALVEPLPPAESPVALVPKDAESVAGPDEPKEESA